MNLVGFVDYWAREAPSKPALVSPERSLSYAEFKRETERFASALRELGVNPGDRVFSLLPNSLEFIISFYGTLRAGAIFVPVNPGYQRQDLAAVLPDCTPRMIITSQEKLPLIQEFFPELSRPKVVLTDGSSPDALTFQELLELREGASFPEPADDDVAELIYTSGTTGEPKGAMLTHDGLARNAFVFSQTMKFTPDDISLLMAPVFHIAAQTCVLNVSLVSGATVVVYKGWNLHRFFELFQKYGVTYFFGPPTLYIQVLEAYKRDKHDLSTWRTAFSGAAPVPEEVFCRFQEVFGFPIIEGYGLSETSPVITHNPIEGPQKPGSIGRPFPGVEIRIVDDDDRELPPGEVGELVTRSPYLMKGYWNKPEETAEAMRGGWFHTGDLAYVDEDGYYYIVDRKKDMINKGGCKVYPREVEEVLFKHPAVLEVAVVGVTDPLRGEEVKAYVVPRPGIEVSVRELKNYCKENLASYKVPRYIEFVSALPKTTTGKVLRRLLREK
ncbi:MAG: O-succinylbenzoate--CoA ligase [Thermoanaerobacterales bacterium 50_218]|nr:MAG: O-succinylbenzoate--CoA ligase [Thermoanaerobacterales bacterium 50_218]HAA90010.1 o-succinylbenzoate--CoA ligase [Peptococcaceae bacterium]